MENPADIIHIDYPAYDEDNLVEREHEAMVSIGLLDRHGIPTPLYFSVVDESRAASNA